MELPIGQGGYATEETHFLFPQHSPAVSNTLGRERTPLAPSPSMTGYCQAQSGSGPVQTTVTS